MSTSLLAASFQAQFAWQMSKSNTPFGNTKQGGDQINVLIQPDVTNIFQNVWLQNVALALGNNTTLDLFAPYTDLVGAVVNPTKVCGLILAPSGADIKLEPGAANPLTWFFGGTTPSITVPNGGVFLLGQPLAQTIDATHRNIKLTNLSGSNALTALIGFLVGP